MSWRNTNVENIRAEFIEKVINANITVTEICELYGISRKTGYKWLSRFHEGGVQNLVDQPRNPNHRPNDTDPDVVKLIIETRVRFPHWGAKKIIPYLVKKQPNIKLPSDATVGNILRRKGYTVKGKRNPRMAGTSPLKESMYPNHVWTLDFKGWWKVKDGKICEPFTVCDMYSRYLLYCQPIPNRSAKSVWNILEDLFEKHGMPDRCRSDNGPPFASIGIGRLSSLSIQLVKAGVIPEWIRPGKPQDNGRHERMHRTMKKEVALDPAPTISKQRQQLLEFQEYYNCIRPHEALEMETPSAVYKPSLKLWRDKAIKPDYPSNYFLRKVEAGGQISLYGHRPFISEQLKGEFVGIEELPKGFYKLYYGPIFLGTFEPTNGFKRF